MQLVGQEHRREWSLLPQAGNGAVSREDQMCSVETWSLRESIAVWLEGQNESPCNNPVRGHIIRPITWLDCALLRTTSQGGEIGLKPACLPLTNLSQAHLHGVVSTWRKQVLVFSSCRDVAWTRAASMPCSVIYTLKSTTLERDNRVEYKLG